METGQSRIAVVLLDEMRSISHNKFPQWLIGSFANTMLSFAQCAPKSLSWETEDNYHSKSADHYTSQFSGGGRKMDWSVAWQGTEATDITTENSITNYTAMCSITDESNCWNQGKSCLYLKIHSEWCVQETWYVIASFSVFQLRPTGPTEHRTLPLDKFADVSWLCIRIRHEKVAGGTVKEEGPEKKPNQLPFPLYVPVCPTQASWL